MLGQHRSTQRKAPSVPDDEAALREEIVALARIYGRYGYRRVAALLRVSNMTVYRLINAGELPAVRVGKSYRLREDDVDKYLADRYTEAG